MRKVKQITYLLPFAGSITTARALFAAALSNDFVILKLQLLEKMYEKIRLKATETTATSI